MPQPTTSHSAPTAPRVPLPAVLVLVLFVYACAIYVNLSLAVRNSADYRFFPPFRRHENANQNHTLAMENFNIARSLSTGQGFAHPFNGPTGPTAWMPPILPGIEAGLLWVSGGNREAVMAVVVFLQLNVLIGTGLLVLRQAGQTTRRVGTGLAVAAFVGGMLIHFDYCFQTTQDCWLVLLAVDLLMAGFCWWRPLHSWRRAAGWGLLGGVCALINPIAGFAWGALSFLMVVGPASRPGPGAEAPLGSRGLPALARLGVAVLVAGLTLTPWTVRNYLVF